MQVCLDSTIWNKMHQYSILHVTYLCQVDSSYLMFGLIHFLFKGIFTILRVYGQFNGKQCRPWSDAAFAMSDLGLRCSPKYCEILSTNGLTKHLDRTDWMLYTIIIWCATGSQSNTIIGFCSVVLQRTCTVGLRPWHECIDADTGVGFHLSICPTPLIDNKEENDTLSGEVT